MNTRKKCVLALLAALPLSSFAMDFNVSGFGSLYAGSVVKGEGSEYFESELEEEDCPCYISNYYDASYYTDGEIDFDKDSTYGFKADIGLTDWLKLSGQVEGLGGNNFEPELTWLYARFNITDSIEIDLGRKAIPLYFYSDVLNVRYSMPWVRVSGDIYGWPLISYNGLSVTYRADIGEGALRTHAWVGTEEDNNNRAYRDLYWASDKYYIEWSKMAGLALEYDYDWISARVVGMTSKATERVKYYQLRDKGYVRYGTEPDGKGWGIVSNNVTSNFYGASIMIDRNDVLVQIEANSFDADDYSSSAYSVAAGYRIGSVTPMIGFSSFKDKDPDFGRQMNTTTSLVVRWDFMKQMALKAQYDILKDKTVWPDYGDGLFTGDSEVFTAGIDYVF